MSDTVDEIVEDVEYVPRAYYSFSYDCWKGGIDDSGFDRCPEILSPDEVDSINRGGRGHYRESDMTAALAAWYKQEEIAAIVASAGEADEDTIWLSR